MANSKNAKTISLYVPISFPLKGKKVKFRLDHFIAWLWKNYRWVVKEYPHFKEVKQIAEGWDFD